MRSDPIKVNAIKNMPSPKTKEDVHRFLGMVNYLAKFVKKCQKSLNNSHYYMGS